MPIGELVSVGTTALINAVFLVAGFFVARMLAGFVGKYIPQIAAKFIVIGIGVLLAVMAPWGVVQSLGMGAATMGMVALVDEFLTPVLQSTVGAAVGSK